MTTILKPFGFYLSRLELIKLVLILSITSSLAGWLTKNIEVIVSPSIDHRIFIKDRGEIVKDAYLRFSIQSKFLPAGATTITKRIGCVAGDTLTTTNRSHFCNGRYLGTAKLESIKGEPLPLFDYNGVIPIGFAFMNGSHHDSFDSRYWGFLDLSKPDIIPMTPIF